MMINAAAVFAPFVYVLVDKMLEDGVYEKVKVSDRGGVRTAGAYVWNVTVKNRAKMCDAFFDWYYSEYFDTFVDYNNSLLLPPPVDSMRDTPVVPGAAPAEIPLAAAVALPSLPMCALCLGAFHLAAFRCSTCGLDMCALMVGAHRTIPSTSKHPLTPLPPLLPTFEAEIFMRKYPLGPQHPKVLVGDGELNQQERMTAPATRLRFIERDIRTMRNSAFFLSRTASSRATSASASVCLIRKYTRTPPEFVPLNSDLVKLVARQLRTKIVGHYS